MAHIIETIKYESLAVALEQLREAHSFVASRAVAAQKSIGTNIDHWGLAAKRLFVSLEGGPALIGKPSEKFVELINILATTERTMEALEWFALHYPQWIVRECHPSTSDFEGGNDIVLIDERGNVKVRCEVCDVA